MKTNLVKNILSRAVLLLLVTFSVKCFSQEVVFYSDTIVFEQIVSPEAYYEIDGNFEELVESPRFKDIGWFVNQLKAVKSEKRLNDYFTYEVLKNYSEIFFTKRHSQKYRAAFVYAVLNELEFDVVVSNKNVIYVSSEDEIHNLSLYKKGKKKYYRLYPFLKNSIYSYNIHAKKKTNKKKSFVFRVKEVPKMSNAEYIHKMVSFAIGRDIFKERVVLNKTVLGMFEQYPRASFCIYGQTDFSDSLKGSFEKNILPKLKGKNNEETVRNILSFSQSVSRYQEDRPERSLFPEEFLFYGKGDCEDYSILFVYLVREYTGLNTVFINYPSDRHINSAVHFPQKIEKLIHRYTLDGDEYYEKPRSIKVKGKEYYICEPTGVGGREAGEPITYDLVIGDAPSYDKYKVIDCSCDD
jgi:hypothetical protein